MDLPRSIVALGATWFIAQAHAECASVEMLISPRDSTIHDARPGIKWAALSGVKLYRVQIESRVPQGQVQENSDCVASESPIAIGSGAPGAFTNAPREKAKDCAPGSSHLGQVAGFSLDGG
jgi:hypothetical protein